MGNVTRSGVPGDVTAALTWRKSTRSIGNSQCVEAARFPGGLAIRDSKDKSGPVLLFTANEWRSFLGGVKNGKFDKL
jgi:hypothetical protein